MLVNFILKDREKLLAYQIIYRLSSRKKIQQKIPIEIVSTQRKSLAIR